MIINHRHVFASRHMRLSDQIIRRRIVSSSHSCLSFFIYRFLFHHHDCRCGCHHCRCGSRHATDHSCRCSQLGRRGRRRRCTHRHRRLPVKVDARGAPPDARRPRQPVEPEAREVEAGRTACALAAQQRHAARAAGDAHVAPAWWVGRWRGGGGGGAV